MLRYEFSRSGGDPWHVISHARCPSGLLPISESKSPYLSIGLTVVIDADKLSVQERLRQLDEALRESAQRVRQIGERIGIFVPKRNIETWIHYHKKTDVTEEIPYPKLECESDCKPLVEDLVRYYCVKGLDSSAPDSLRQVCAELKRILP